MKIKKFLIGLVSVFSLTSFSVSVAATNSSAIVKKEENFTSENFKNLFINSFSKLNKIFENHYKSCKNKEKELKDLNEKDLKKLLKILKDILNEVEKDNENFAKIEGSGEYKDILKEIVKDFFKLIKTNKKFSQELKNRINGVKNIYNYKNIEELLKIYVDFIEKIENNVISEDDVNKLIDNLNIKMTDTISISIKVLNGIIDYVEKNLNNSDVKNKINEILKNINIKEYYKLFN